MDPSPTRRKLAIGIPQGSVFGPLLFKSATMQMTRQYMLMIAILKVSSNHQCTMPSNYKMVSKQQNEAEWGHVPPDGIWRQKQPCSYKYRKCKINGSTEERLLGVIYDKQFSFRQQVMSLCEKTGQKLHAFSKVSDILDTEQMRKGSDWVLEQTKYLKHGRTWKTRDHFEYLYIYLQIIILYCYTLP